MRTLDICSHENHERSKTAIMGVLNVTPDSFYDGGRFFNVDLAVMHGLELIDAGADILDIGGESTRPGSIPIDAKEEIDRVIPVIKILGEITDIPISIDTYKSEVAETAIKYGATMINDISALRFDEDMGDIAAEYDLPISLMHMQGIPRDMQVNPQYRDIMQEIIYFFKERMDFAIEKGISEDKIIIDPGIGFGKRTGDGIEDNCTILKRLRELKSLNKPILVGTSRKTFISNICNESSPEDRLIGSLATVAIAVANGADIVRVHDVRETKDVVDVVSNICRR
ncbi:MAG: dihydropteroate synthase [Candidatus Methanoliparum thermophilum]|uniref:dihydropteroate synthase n=2 Tax=Candidatus Methanoliparum TaxID=2545692 RepID=A0A520KTG1_METT2|nr:MAG: dihydropteroate synthase [Candidatus Methanoliparum thermophilum]BDC36586.1 dihydropteroate synthase [Candidatus Methanoliparum sp. LAM-1]